MQMQELEKYREIIRKVHSFGIKIPDVNNFDFEVLAAPKIGATVTAYHKHARLIQRGTVLAHNKKAAIFLIQFERKELGWDWVKDVEIASHGVPEILISKRNPLTLCSIPHPDPNDFVPEHGSLPYGTTFSPLIGEFLRTLCHIILRFMFLIF